MEDIIFSLDIGTRNVVGIVAKMEDDTYKVIDYEIMEHPDRAMYDGQIHDIEKVSNVVGLVKEKLEERNGQTFSYVSIAAAGRALKTQKVLVEDEIDSTKVINNSLINSLELQGIQEAQKELENAYNNLETKYYCVGYTVINYYLDENQIGNLRGHKGNRIGAELLATFLPHVVVDSLYTVVHNVGLEVISLTLEPIAAINIAIPPKFRLLNLALVDVGAGTSDIAITKGGTIASYAMVSFAGDEITEGLSNAFLLDFITAEKLKIGLTDNNNHKFTDIVGMEYSLSTDEIVSRVEGVIEELSEKVSERIVEYNGKAPSAVFCIGGGSQIPKFTEYLANKLDLPKERVVVRGIDALENLEFLCGKLKGPEFITPLGIGYTAYKDKEQDFLRVNVNGKSIRLFNSKELSVSDALILVGFNARNLIAKKGKTISVEINGERKLFHGDYGEPAKIFINGEPANLDTKLKSEDSIVIQEATHGRDAVVRIDDVVNRNEKITMGDETINLVKAVKVNGRKTEVNYLLSDDDRLEIEKIDTIKELLELKNIDFSKSKIYSNNNIVSEDYVLKNQDIINIVSDGDKASREEDYIEAKKNKKDYISVRVNGKIFDLRNTGKKLIFVEIFNHIDFDTKKANGILALELNGERANYTDVLKDGDEIKVYWK